MTLEFLQSYWWILVALLAGLLVFLMFVQEQTWRGVKGNMNRRASV